MLADHRYVAFFDEGNAHDFGDAWTDRALADRVAVVPDGFSLATDREETVPVEVEVADRRPEGDLDGWDHAVIVGCDVPSGKLVLDDPGRDFDDAPRIEVEAGPCTALILSRGLGSAEGKVTGGDDRYRVVIWPGSSGAPEVLKRWEPASS